MLKALYTKGTVASSKCCENTLTQFLRSMKKEGYNLHFIEDDQSGTIIPDGKCSVNEIIERGQTVVLKSKKCENVIVARKLREDERAIAYGLTHMYDVISICTTRRFSRADYSHRLSNLYG